jgi:hypothetical protein
MRPLHAQNEKPRQADPATSCEDHIQLIAICHGRILYRVYPDLLTRGVVSDFSKYGAADIASSK